MSTSSSMHYMKSVSTQTDGYEKSSPTNQSVSVPLDLFHLMAKSYFTSKNQSQQRIGALPSRTATTDIEIIDISSPASTELNPSVRKLMMSRCYRRRSEKNRAFQVFLRSKNSIQHRRIPKRKNECINHYITKLYKTQYWSASSLFACKILT